MASRNWNALGNLGFHFGINKNTFENSDRDEDINLFFGIDKEINDSFSLLMEYNFARDDDEISHDNCSENCIDIERLGKGYLNAGLRWSATENLMLEINVNDILKNSVYNHLEDDEFVDLDDPNLLFHAQPRGISCHWIAGNVDILGIFSVIQALITKNVSICVQKFINTL